jgi:hypothetical protein
MRESEILMTLGFNLTFPTHIDYIDKILYDNFEQEVSDDERKVQMTDLRNTSIYILKMCMHEVNFMNYKLDLIATAIVIYSVQIFCDTCIYALILSN